MDQPTQAPSRVSIGALALLAVLVIVAAFWIGYPPDEQYTSRHSVGFILALVLGTEILLQAASRARRRMVALEHERRAAWRASQADRRPSWWPDLEPDDGAHNG